MVPCRKTAGQKQLDEWKRAGQQVTPQMEKLAAWLDKMDSSIGDSEVSASEGEGESCVRIGVLDHHPG